MYNLHNKIISLNICLILSFNFFLQIIHCINYIIIIHDIYQ